MKISDQLKQCRKAKGMTQREVAEKMHVSRKTISGWENGRSYPDVNMLISLSDLFGVSADDLIRGNRRGREQGNSWPPFIFMITYSLNIGLLAISYLHMYDLPGFHSPITSFLLLINELILFLGYDNWANLRHRFTLFTMFSGFFGFLIINFTLNLIWPAWTDSFINANPFEALGMVTGRLILCILLSISLIMAIFFRPKKL